ncbi:MAG: hypothetical protein ONA90_05760 [candidate division KSB1 bacterium]|nr:hypothetical protein [candidate division KSB1 bacterium]
MGRNSLQRQAWDLTETRFNQLLAELDSNREQAAMRYETLRQRLIKFFQWYHCCVPEELADEIMDRAARDICENHKKLEADHSDLYFLSMARYLLYEYWRRQKSIQKAIEKAGPNHADHQPESDSNHAILVREQEYEKRCLQSLLFEEQKLLVRYYEGRGRPRSQNRQKLAAELGVTLNALRYRIFWIKKKLKKSVDGRMQRALKSAMY